MKYRFKFNGQCANENAKPEFEAVDGQVCERVSKDLLGEGWTVKFADGSCYFVYNDELTEVKDENS